MKVFEVSNAFGLENLKLVQRERPALPGPGRVLLKVKAVSLNYRDLMVVLGKYNPRQPLPLVPCSDAAAEVVAVGPGVTRVKAGDRVAPTFCQTWLGGVPTNAQLRSTLGSPADGTLAEYMVLDEAGLVHLPAYLTDEEASCLPCAAVTAWNALTVLSSLQPEQAVLIQGSGGVAVFAIQIARALGAHVLVVSGSPEKLERLEQLGAEHVIERQPGWGRRVRELTAGRGVDQVIELGGAEMLTDSITAAASGGAISLIGVISGLNSDINIGPVVMNQIRLQGVLVGSRSSFEQMNDFFEAKQIRPVVDRVFAFPEARAAFEHLSQGRHFGKLVITF